MNLNRIAVVMAVAFAFANEADAATACVQNKSSGVYEPKTPTKENAGDCASMNKAATAAIVDQVAAPAVAPPVVRAPAIAATDLAVSSQPNARTVAAVVLPQSPAPVPLHPLDPAQQVRTYRLKTSDLTVRLALNRWLKEANMQLAYEASEEFSATVEGDYTGTMPEVLFKLMTSLKQTKYPMRACEYDNHVVLVVHRDDVCPLEDE
jgi:hypothetical protein